MSRVQTTTTGTTPQTATATRTVMPTHEQIAKRAYEKWVKRGRPEGTHLQDWYEAEAELKREMASGTYRG
ncbi:MAG: DUF2934 domain-containing protein [Gemmatales bacterium]|nr:DUF2934 domain-containing protein [Gemmatales bacterium]MDW8386204.1 DUF2934 domain-containing protein [Gemmatales bacterium]